MVSSTSLLIPNGAAQSTAGSVAPHPSASADRKALQKQAVAFEAMYLAQMLQPMFDGLKGVEPFSGGFGEDVWRSLQVQEFGKAIAEGGGIGLADRVTQELIRLQEAGQETWR